MVDQRRADDEAARDALRADDDPPAPIEERQVPRLVDEVVVVGVGGGKIGWHGGSEAGGGVAGRRAAAPEH